MESSDLFGATATNSSPIQSGAQLNHSGFLKGGSYFESKISQVLLLLSLTILQGLLLHPTFSKSLGARLARVALTPVIFLGVINFSFQNAFRPFEDHVLDNFAMGLTAIYNAARSLEWGFVKGPNYSTPLRCIDGVQKWIKEEPSEAEKRAQEEKSVSALELIGWAIHQNYSVRGFGFQWGMAHETNNATFFELVLRFYKVKIAAVCATFFIVACRDSAGGSPVHVLRALGVPDFYGLEVLSGFLLNIAFGICVCSRVDNGFTACIILAKLVYKLTALLNAPKAVREFFNPLYYPHAFYSPHLCNSVAEFWGKGWHQLLRRLWLTCGGKPGIFIARKCGLSQKTEKAIGLMCVFLASGILHEYLSWVAFQESSPNPHLPFKSFPGAGVFFMLQSLGIFVEPYIIPHIPKWAGGGKIWVWGFIGASATPFRRQYIAPFRFASTAPTLSKISLLKELIRPA